LGDSTQTKTKDVAQVVKIGIAVIVLGVLSLVLGPLHVEILEWADGVQPVLGIVLALVGVALVGFHGLRKKKTGQPTDS
jgi:drug/metabolite transporter (DMT)-like permease